MVQGSPAALDALVERRASPEMATRMKLAALNTGHYTPEQRKNLLDSARRIEERLNSKQH